MAASCADDGANICVQGLMQLHSYIDDETMMHVGHVESFKISGPLGTTACQLVCTCVVLEPRSISHVVWMNPCTMNSLKTML